MSKEVQNSFLEVTFKEVDKQDPDYDLFKKISEYIHVSLINPGAEGVGIFRESFTDIFVGGYYIKENGSGTFQKLVKIVEGVPKEIRPSLTGEMAIIKGSGVTPLNIPKGWKIVDDSEVQSKYNIGTSPNWKVAAIEYIGI